MIDQQMSDARLSRELRATIRCHQALLRATDEQELLDSICKIIHEDADYILAWVGYAVHDDAKSIRTVACAGEEQGYLSEIEISWDDSELGSCPVGAAIRTCAPNSVDDFATAPSVARLAEAATSRGFVGCIGLPLIGADGKAFGALAVYASTDRRFDDDERALLQGFATDLAFGINALRLRASAQKQNQLFQAAWQASPDAMLITSVGDGTVSDVNEGFTELFGWPRDRVIGRTVAELGVWMNLSDREQFIGALLERGTNRHLVRNFGKADGAAFVGDISASVITLEGEQHILSILRDITGEYEAMEALRLSESRLRAVTDVSHDFIWEIDADVRYTYLSPKVAEVLGYEPDELIGRSPYELMPPAVAERAKLEFEGHRAAQRPFTGLLNTCYHKDGREIILETSAVPVVGADGSLQGYRGADRDITERESAEREMRSRNEMLSQAQRIARLGHYIFEPQNNSWSSSPALSDIFGIDASYEKDVAGWLRIIHPDDQPRMADYVAEHVLDQHLPFDAHYRIVRISDGEERHVHGLGELELDESGDVVRMFGVIQDVSDRERVQKELKESEDRYRSISETVTSFVYSCVRTPSQTYLIDWMAGAVESLTGYSADLVIQRGCWRFAVHPDDMPLFDERIADLSVGEAATAELRIVRADGTLRWVRSSASASAMPETPGGVRIVGSVEDITEKRQSELDLVATNARLEGVLKSLTETMAKVVEARDPYTEGHERGVARIARQIAERMGFTEREIEGIEVAANVHDIGKLAIPAEILSKPSRLSAIEYEFVKQHSQAGHDILSGIDFDWPVAQMALQHHERMDGSGYPGGLSGDQILIGSRIVMVADVVDAMASHRPYRPALGLDVAVNEIRSNPDKYDPAVSGALQSLYEDGLIKV